MGHLSVKIYLGGGNFHEVVTNKYFATPYFWQTNVGQLEKLTNVRYATWATAA